MSWGYRRSRRLGPGLRLNVSKRAIGVSMGPRHARMSINTRGRQAVYLSLLGVFFRKKLRSGRR